MALEVGNTGWGWAVCRDCTHTDDDEPDVWTDSYGDTYFEGETVASLRAFLDRHDRAAAPARMASNIQPMPDPYEEARKVRHARRYEGYRVIGAAGGFAIECACGLLIYQASKDYAEAVFRRHQEAP